MEGTAVQEAFLCATGNRALRMAIIGGSLAGLRVPSQRGWMRPFSAQPGIVPPALGVIPKQ